MALVGGRCFLEYIFNALRRAEFHEAILCVGYKASAIQDWLGDGRHWGLQVRYSVEDKLLGTAGALKLAADMVESESCFVLNGDSFLDVDFRGLFRFHVQNHARATIALAQASDAARYGSVTVDLLGRVTSFSEKGKSLEGAPLVSDGLKTINGGVYVLEREVLEEMPPAKRLSLECDVFPSLVGEGLYGYSTSGYFVDIGTAEDFTRAQTELPTKFPT